MMTLDDWRDWCALSKVLEVLRADQISEEEFQLKVFEDR
jgi:hypothetical protein